MKGLCDNCLTSNVDVISVREINPVILLKSNKVAVTADALKQIEEWING